jgi:hypothetical protein
MSEQGDVELFNGPKPSEKKEGSDEKFREEMASTQQALAQLKKEEGQAKAYDNSLAAIIVQFLSRPENTDLFLLVSRTVAQNIPSELIIAILSLIDKRSHEETKGYLEAGKQAGHTEETALAIHKNANFESLSPAHKKVIDKWVSSISQISMKKPHRALETLVIPGPERELSSVVVQLSAFILRNYLKRHETPIDFQILRDFMEGVFLEIVKNLEELVKGQKQLV